MISEIPLDLGFCAVLTKCRPSKRTDIGTARRASAPSLGVVMSESGAGAGQGPPTTSNRVSFAFRGSGTTRSRRRAGYPGNREHGAASGQTGSSRDRRQRRPAGFRRVIGGFGEETESARFAVSETGCGTEPTDLGSPQLASERAVPLGTRTVGSGNRVSVTSDKSGRPTGNRRTEPHTRHRPPCASTTGDVIGRVEG